MANDKLEVLQLILEQKDILFGKLDDSLGITNARKQEEWNIIYEKLIARGNRYSTKDKSHLRDVLWRNWKKAAKEKRDRFNKTGAPGGCKARYTEEELIIFDIIGAGSPELDGLDITESMTAEGENDTSIKAANDIIDATFDTPNAAGSSGSYRPSKRPRPTQSPAVTKQSLDERRQQKLDLELENLQLKNYQLKLDILKKEQEMHIPTYYGLPHVTIVDEQTVGDEQTPMDSVDRTAEKPSDNSE